MQINYNVLTRLLDTSNVAVVKNCFVWKGDCRITNCQTNLNTERAEPKPLDKPENIIEIATFKWLEYNKQFEENV